MKPRNAKNIGVPAQTIVSILIDIVLNLTAELHYNYQKFQKYKCKQLFRSQRGKILLKNSQYERFKSWEQVHLLAWK